MSQTKLTEFKSRLPPKSEKPWHDEEWLRERYWEDEMSIGEIADSYDLNKVTIFEWMEKHGIERRSQKEANQLIDHSGRDSTTWQEWATYSMDPRGYMRWSGKYEGKRSELRVHRLVAVAEHGFEAVAESVVHHKNQIPWDNRPENLELLNPAEHGRAHKY
jgi:hypothetical protein